MKRLLLMLFVISIFLPNLAFPQKAVAGAKLWASMYWDLQRKKAPIEEKIKEINSDIAFNENKLKEINELLAENQRLSMFGTDKQKKGAELARPLLEQALARTKDTLRKIKTIRIEYEMMLNRINDFERQIRADSEEILKQKDAAGYISECTGGVKIVNTKTRRTENACSPYTVLNKGDMITTSTDGQARLNILEGRGYITVGPNSSFRIREDNEVEQIIEPIEGKGYFKIDKPEEHANKVKEYIEKYKEDLKTIKGWTEEKIDELKKEGVAKYKQLSIWLCQKMGEGLACVRVPHAVFGVRGTEFTVDREGEYLGKATVIEGSIEVTNNIKNEKVIVPAGYQVIINSDGTINKKKIENIEKWWLK